MPDIPTLVSLLGALGLGSVVGQYLTQGSQRRETRAAVLKALGTLELARWVGPEAERPPFKVSVQELEAAALVARTPRDVVRRYVTLATASWWESHTVWGEAPEEDLGGYVPAWLNEATKIAAEDLANCIWRPFLSRVGIKGRLRDRDERLLPKEEGRAGNFLARARANLLLGAE